MILWLIGELSIACMTASVLRTKSPKLALMLYSYQSRCSSFCAVIDSPTSSYLVFNGNVVASVK